MLLRFGQHHDCICHALPALLQVNEAMRSHKRYMHYFERYKQHMDSLTKEKNNRWVMQQAALAVFSPAHL